MENLTVLQEQIGYRFKNRALLLQALTHSSFASGECPNNERLEFLGDAVLELCVSKYLFATYPSMAEGVMSRVRASAVCEGSLYRAAQPFRLGEWLRLGRSEERTGGRRKASIVSDAMEAIIGAIYFEGGFEAAERFVLSFAPQAVERALQDGDAKDSKTRLQELLQRQGNVQIDYRLIEERGPDHAKWFTMAVAVGDRELGRGEGHSKKEAEQAAAQMALAALARE